MVAFDKLRALGIAVCVMVGTSACTSGADQAAEAIAAREPSLATSTPQPPEPTSSPAAGLQAPAEAATPAPSTPSPTSTSLTEETDTVDVTQPWQLQGHVNPVASAVAAVFATDADFAPLGQRFFPLDETAADELDACFDSALRNAIGDAAVEDYYRLSQTEADFASPEAIAARRSGRAAVLQCMSPEQVRTELIETDVASWNTYVRPSGAPVVDPRDACVDNLYSSVPIEFEQQWLGHEERRDKRAGTCLVAPVYLSDEPGEPPPAETTASGQTLTGTRGLTLQWISWEPNEWGHIDFSPLGDEHYTVEGRQDASDGGYLYVQGTVTRVSATELHLQGTVETRTGSLNDGAICARFGEFTFVATQGRQFWRMQDQINCDGATTDYVDIYFG